MTENKELLLINKWMNTRPEPNIRSFFYKKFKMPLYTLLDPIRLASNLMAKTEPWFPSWVMILWTFCTFKIRLMQVSASFWHAGVAKPLLASHMALASWQILTNLSHLGNWLIWQIESTELEATSKAVRERTHSLNLAGFLGYISTQTDLFEKKKMKKNPVFFSYV